MAHITIVEDEPKIAQLVADYLARDGHEVTLIDEGTHASSQVLTTNTDLAILDLMLPGKDGLTVCQEIRAVSDVPIIMLTARVEEVDRLLGLDLGADDYICKPFSPREVVARVRTILRRARPSSANKSTTTTYGNVTVDADAMVCQVDGADIELTAVEFRILAALLERPGRVLSREQIMQQAYDDFRVVSDRTIDSHMKKIRKKLGDKADVGVNSVYGVGYKIG